MTSGLKRLIVVSPEIENRHRKRFTIAHEIGHIFLHHGNRECIATDLHRWDDKLSKEFEANSFAAELLLPYKVMKGAIQRSDLCFNLVETIAEDFDTSLSSAAIRLAKLDKGMSAVVYHDGEQIDWIIRSPSCRNDFSERYISIANQTKRDINCSVDPSLWFTGDTDGWECTEETRYYKKIAHYLTLINIYEL